MTEKMELKAFALFLASTFFAEVITSFLNPAYGFLSHAVILMSLLILSASRHGDNPASNMFLSLSLAPLIRILSLSLPLAYFPRYAWYSVAGVPVLAAAATMIRVQGLSLEDVGLTFKKPLIQTGLALTGIPFGMVEYFILKPEPLALGFTPIEYFLLALALIFFTGFVEELVFRGVIQITAIKALGEKVGVFGVTAVFAILHIGWLSALDVVFVFLVGLLFAVSTFRTGSIVGSILSHGLTNVVLFLVMPFLP